LNATILSIIPKNPSIDCIVYVNMAHFGHTMLPLQICYQFYACLILLAFFVSVSMICIALMTLYGVGGVELVFTICFVAFHALIRLFMPPWGESRSASSTTSTFGGDSVREDDDEEPKRLALDKYAYIIEKEEDQREEDNIMTSSCCCYPTDKSASSSCASPCCPICLHTFQVGDEMSKSRVCGHIFHSDCLTPWLFKSTTCPYCRQDLEDRTKSGGCGVRKSGAWGVFDGIFD
jgi:hypothetical protein